MLIKEITLQYGNFRHFVGNLLIFFSVKRFQTVALLLFTTHDASLILLNT